VTHPFAADDTFSYEFTVLVDGGFAAADTFVFRVVRVDVLDRSEDALTKETIAFRLLSSIVNRFRLGNFAVAPFKNIFRAGDSEADGRKVGNRCAV
jgi:hypothetical protein